MAASPISIACDKNRLFPLEPLRILILAVVQGAAELLPVSGPAHVIVAEKLMGLNPVAPR